MSCSVSHPVFSRFYPYIARAGEKGGAGEHRRTLLAGLSGRVIEFGAGHGLNFGYYPSTVSEVVAVERETHLRELARLAAEQTAMSVRIAEGSADALPGADGEFDAAVASLVLCSVPDRDVALREIHRLLRVGGELRFYEHVIARKPSTARVQRALDATIYPFLTGGWDCARDTVAAIARAGFEIEREERIAFKPSPLAPRDPPHPRRSAARLNRGLRGNADGRRGLLLYGDRLAGSVFGEERSARARSAGFAKATV